MKLRDIFKEYPNIIVENYGRTYLVLSEKRSKHISVYQRKDGTIYNQQEFCGEWRYMRITEKELREYLAFLNMWKEE